MEQARKSSFGPTAEGHQHFSHTPRRTRRQSHPNLPLLGFRPKLKATVQFKKTSPVSGCWGLGPRGKDMVAGSVPVSHPGRSQASQRLQGRLSGGFQGRPQAGPAQFLSAPACWGGGGGGGGGGGTFGTRKVPTVTRMPALV